MKKFREFHLFQILEQYETHSLPLDVLLRNYFRQHKAVGAKDRRFICETLYGILRWRGLLDHLGPKPSSWQRRFETFVGFNPSDHLSNESIPPHIRVSFPKDYFQCLEQNYGLEKALDLCLISNSQAPTTIRVNTIKTTREQLLARWKGLYPVSPCPTSEHGIIFQQRFNFFGMPEFKEGLFEIQDEASQLIARLVEVKPGDHILDFCAGSGGKTLALAPSTQNKGQIYLHDIRPFALEEAKKRLRRAGIQNAQILTSFSQLAKKMDWILVDAPCSGSGTLRRNPDMKWKFESDLVPRLVCEQRAIFAQALEHLKPGGKIVYATCSIFKEENEEQAAFFQKTHGLELVSSPFKTLPVNHGMDGFFGAVFKRGSCKTRLPGKSDDF